MNSSNKKVIMILAPQNFRDEEYFEPREVLEKNGIQVEVASIADTAISGIEQVDVQVDKRLAEVGDQYDAVIFIGGGGAKIYTTMEPALNLARRYLKNGKIVAAICIAPLILAHAGILKDKKATIWDGAGGELQGFGAQYTAEKVTVDGNIITGNGPKAARKFGKAIVKALK